MFTIKQKQFPDRIMRNSVVEMNNVIGENRREKFVELLFVDLGRKIHFSNPLLNTHLCSSLIS